MPTNRDFEVKNGLRVGGGLINANNGTVSVSGNVSVSQTLSTAGNTSVGGTLSVTGDSVLNKASIDQVTIPVVGLGTIASGGTAQINWNNGSVFTLAMSGAATWAFTNLPTGYWEVHVIATNPGAGTISFTGVGTGVNWVKGDGSSSTTFSTLGVTLQSSGVNQFVFWGIGTTVYGKAA